MEVLFNIPFAIEVALWLGAYLIGSVSFGYLALRATGHGDIRTMGSKGTGATNALRIAGKAVGAAVLIGDLAKGAIPVALALAYGNDKLALLVASGIFFGHLFPCWLNFKGGKAVASLIGVTLVLDWRIAAAFCVCWVIVAGLTRYSSLASLASVIIMPVSAALLDADRFILPAIVAMLFVIYAHRANIQRLLNRTETKIT
ncbi:MAG: glycerol-3-phosphate 1-O-acyltransferase PlsY [Hyphomicrobiales bacterium]|nr:glycerol-3-phosphate 1-O-acyltransferase PlsY [Hyphomicrobiales bacterium]